MRARPHALLIAWMLGGGLAVASWGPVPLTAGQATARGLGQPLLLNGISVALLSVEPLADRDLTTPHGLARGGLRIVWLVENQPGAPLPPVLGDIRVFFGSRLYNSVTNATSRKPFAPDMIVHGPARFFGGPGKPLERLAPPPRPGAVTVVLEVYVRGGVIPPGASGVAEIELGDSTAAAGAPVRYDWFRFQLPRL